MKSAANRSMHPRSNQKEAPQSSPVMTCTTKSILAATVRDAHMRSEPARLTMVTQACARWHMSPTTTGVLCVPPPLSRNSTALANICSQTGAALALRQRLQQDRLQPLCAIWILQNTAPRLRSRFRAPLDGRYPNPRGPLEPRGRQLQPLYLVCWLRDEAADG
jgi:hypothetical protein